MTCARKQNTFSTAELRRHCWYGTWTPAVAVGITLWIAGCNQSTPEPQAQNLNWPDNQEQAQHPLDEAENPRIADSDDVQPRVLHVQTASSRQTHNLDVTAQADNVRNKTAGASPASELSSGTPEWDIRQIAAILAEARKAQLADGNAGKQATLSDEQNRRIVALATHAISQTHSRPEKELVFNAAVHSLVDARLNLALAGDRVSLDAIYQDASALAEKHPGSTAAATAAAGVVRLAQSMALREGRQSPWVGEYVLQAKLFGVNFPAEEARAIVQLTSAAEFCEQQQLILPAIECYTFIQQNFPDSPFIERAEAALQRLNLIGKQIPLQGPTLNGTPIHLSQLAGKPVLIAFWSSRSSAFLEDLPLIQELCRQSGCQLLGINLDTHEESVRQFVEAQQLPGHHIFYPDAALQGAAQPVARQFGIYSIPSYWLIDREGKVLSTHVTREQLRSLVANGT
ncbi:MAG: TlpA family protein disulfide reductase [Planctomycetaceae bacterium]|nr:TlpA family protein disulfide reductase [Planctomycetaceae bacterium]